MNAAVSWLLAVVLQSGLGAAGTLDGRVIRWHVDASDISKRLIHVRIDIPTRTIVPELSGNGLFMFALVRPDPIGCAYGPAGIVTNLRISCDGQYLNLPGKPFEDWWQGEKRLAEGKFSVSDGALEGKRRFHLGTAAGGDTINVTFDYRWPADIARIGVGSITTRHLMIVNWGELLICPDGTPPSELQFAASLKIPAGWSVATSLDVDRRDGDTVHFSPRSLESLGDSPVLLGKYIRRMRLAGGNPSAVWVNVAATSEAALDISTARQAAIEHAVAQMVAHPGAARPKQSEILLALSDHLLPKKPLAQSPQVVPCDQWRSVDERTLIFWPASTKQPPSR